LLGKFLSGKLEFSSELTFFKTPTGYEPKSKINITTIEVIVIVLIKKQRRGSVVSSDSLSLAYVSGQAEERLPSR
jgi:hypothetical protein